MSFLYAGIRGGLLLSLCPAAPGVGTLGLRRFINIHEEQSLEIRFEAFNALNTPQFAAPGATQGSGNFGKVTSTTSDNRELQLAMKYFF